MTAMKTKTEIENAGGALLGPVPGPAPVDCNNVASIASSIGAPLLRRKHGSPPATAGQDATR